MKLLYYSKETPIRTEQSDRGKFSIFRGLMTNFCEIAQLLQADNIYSWRQSDIRDHDLVVGSDLYLAKQIYGYDFPNADQDGTYDVMLTSMLRYPNQFKKKPFKKELEEFHRALSRAKCYLYYDHDRELDTHKFVLNKTSQFLVWLAEQDKRETAYRKLRLLLSNSWASAKIMSQVFPDKKVIYLPILDYRPNDVLVDYNLPLAKRRYDFTIMRNLYNWDAIIRKTDYPSKYDILVLEDIEETRDRLRELYRFNNNLFVYAYDMPIGNHFRLNAEILSESLLVAPSGNPQVEKFDLHSMKLLEAKWAGCFIPIHRQNPHFEELTKNTFGFAYDSDYEHLNEFVEFSHLLRSGQISESEFDYNIKQFKHNVSHVMSPDNWKETFSAIATNLE